MFKRKTFNKRTGFTLVELLVVIGVLAILAAIAIPTVAGLIDKSKVTSDTKNANEMTNAIERFTSEYELYYDDVLSGTININDLNATQNRVHSVTSATSRNDFSKLETKYYVDRIAVNTNTKYPVNEKTVKKVIESYTKMSSSAFEPKQTDHSFYYSPNIGVVIVAKSGSSVSELYEIAKVDTENYLDTDYKLSTNGDIIEWINLSINANKESESEWTNLVFATNEQTLYKALTPVDDSDDDFNFVGGGTGGKGDALFCNHIDISVTNVKEPTCTEEGYTGDATCNICGTVISRGSIAVTKDHVIELVNVKDANCAGNGYTGDEKCIECKQIIKHGEVIPSDGHGKTILKDYVAPTCTENGFTGNEVCITCQGIVKGGEVIFATGHGDTVISNKIEATCTNNGYTGDTVCSDCNAIIISGSIVPATGHVETNLVNYSQRTCTTDGYTGDEVCAKCDALVKKGEVLTATGHQNVISKDVVEPTCVLDGSLGSTYCNDCNTYISIGEIIPATGHRNTELRDKIEPTCSSDGYTGDTVCTDCGAIVVEGEVIASVGHIHTEVQNIINATCTTDGYSGDTVCTDCGIIVFNGEFSPALGHNPTVVNNVAATCTEDGYTGDTICSICNETLETGDVIYSNGHIGIIYTDAIEATCTEDGYSGNPYCTVCETDLGEGETIPATGHNPEIRNVVYATCVKNGYSGDTYCTRCDECLATGEEVVSNGHEDIVILNAVTATCTEDGYTGDTYCNNCETIIEQGSIVTKTGHQSTTLKNRKNPTCTEDGYSGDYVCNKCGEITQAGSTIAKLGHSGVTLKNETITYTGDQICSKGCVVVKGNNVACNMNVVDINNLANNTWEEIAIVARTGNAKKCAWIGDTTNVTVNGATYPVRAIGINRDKSASITFEFTKPLSTSVPFNSSPTSGTLWSESTLRSYLNSSLYSQLNISNYIASVERKTAGYTSSSVSTVKTVTTTDKIFILRLEDILGYTKASKYTKVVSGITTPYEYYQNATYSAPSKKTLSSPLVVTSGGYPPNRYLTTLYPNGSQVMYVPIQSTTGSYIYPAFVIGK